MRLARDVAAPGSAALDLVLLDADGRESGRHAFERRRDRWYLDADVAPCQRYRWERTDPAGARLPMLDPWALATDGLLAWDAPLPACVAIDTASLPNPGRSPATPWSDTVIYEAHVQGLTARHPAVPVAARGTFEGLAHPAVLEHLEQLGVTAVELLPVAQWADDRYVRTRGLSNVWGYHPVLALAPEPRLARRRDGGQVAEFAAMVGRLHAAGLEVILDVVLNHTGEGDPTGPAWTFRALDPTRWYHHDADGPWDVTGCGNTVRVTHPDGLAWALAALRHWAGVLGVDGFRFDLAPALLRERAGERFATDLLDAIAADPLLASRKLIAEPWDLGAGGYRLGGFPPGWAEWNDRFRDDVRRVWLGGAAPVEVVSRLAGTPDRFDPATRGPHASINFITAHDGFTLADLVSYRRKRNAANGEGNRDGHEPNFSTDFGVEGPSDDPAVTARRALARRSLWATLLLARGVPMLSHGDELGRSQQGNNNAWCQAGPHVWTPWEAPSADHAFLAFAHRVRALRDRLRVPAGATLDAERGPGGTGGPGLRVEVAHDHVLLLNPAGEALTWPAPPGRWRIVLDTADPLGPERDAPPATWTVAPGALVCLCRLA